MGSKKRRLPRWVFLLGGLAFASGCNEGGETSGENPTLSRDVVPLFQASCGFGSGCHGTARPAGSVQLTIDAEGAAPLLARLKGMSTREPSMPLVSPGDPLGSFLLRKVKGDFAGLSCVPAACGERMPQRSTPLPPEDIELLELWIQQGAPLE
jgi:hypothetical protein